MKDSELKLWTIRAVPRPMWYYRIGKTACFLLYDMRHPDHGSIRVWACGPGPDWAVPHTEEPADRWAVRRPGEPVDDSKRCLDCQRVLGIAREAREAAA